MRLIEKKIRDKIEYNTDQINNSQGGQIYCDAYIDALKWVLSELQKESDLMNYPSDFKNKHDK